MADGKRETEGSTTGGNGWEVVSPTASTYAPVSGPETLDSSEEMKDKHLRISDPEPPMGLFMSDHFVFPPCEHENLPLGAESHDGAGSESQQMRFTVDDDTDYVSKEAFNAKNLPGPEFSGIKYFDKGKKIWVTDIDHEERKEFDGQDMGEAVDGCYSASHVSEAMCCDNDDITEQGHHFSENLDPSSENSQSEQSAKGDKHISPCESWWRRHALSLYTHAKEANKFWSIFVAAAIMGFVILGQRWQQERWHIQQLKWNLSNHDKIVQRVLGPVSRFKDVVIGTHRPGLGGISAMDG